MIEGPPSKKGRQMPMWVADMVAHAESLKSSLDEHPGKDRSSLH
jgi:hypothetical protein